MCPAEKSREVTPLSTEQSVLSSPVCLRNYREKWASFAYFGGKNAGISLQLGLAGGEGGIRTPGTLSGTPVFKTGAINHSATSPRHTILHRRCEQ